jgi:hypothetical protein
MGGWLGPSAGPDAVVKRKIPRPCWGSNTGLSSPLAQRYISEISWLFSSVAEKNIFHGLDI